MKWLIPHPSQRVWLTDFQCSVTHSGLFSDPDPQALTQSATCSEQSSTHSKLLLHIKGNSCPHTFTLPPHIPLPVFCQSVYPYISEVPSFKSSYHWPVVPLVSWFCICMWSFRSFQALWNCLHMGNLLMSLILPVGFLVPTVPCANKYKPLFPHLIAGSCHHLTEVHSQASCLFQMDPISYQQSSFLKQRTMVVIRALSIWVCLDGLYKYLWEWMEK